MNDVDRRIKLRQTFRDWAKTDRDSPLYSAICGGIAEADDILELFDDLPPSKCRPVLLFAAVRYLLLSGVDANSKLAKIYEAPQARGALDLAATAFRMYVDDHYDDVAALMQARSVQTNEVNRCSVMLPALMEVYRQTHQPLGLIEVGASAGPNLLFDRYRYDYDGGPVIGPPGAMVRCHSRIDGGVPRFEQAPPLVETRIGIDLEPVNLRDEDEVRWLQACVWADNIPRIQRLDAAIELAKREWPDVRKGDAIKTLTYVVDEVPDEHAVVLFNSWMMGWMAEPQREAFDAAVAAIAADRPVYWVTYEWANKVPGLIDLVGEVTEGSILGLQRLEGTERQAKVLARVGDHGQWIDWLDPDSRAW